MGLIAHAHKYAAGLFSRTNVGYTTEVSIVDADFVTDSGWIDGAKYWLMGWAQISASQRTTADFFYRWAQGATPTEVTGSVMRWESAAASGPTDRQTDIFGFARVITQATPAEDMHYQIRSDDVDDAAWSRNVTMKAIRLDDDLTEGAEAPSSPGDWVSKTVSGPTTLTTAMVVHGTLSFEPDVAGDDWLIMACTHHDFGGDTAGVQLEVDFQLQIDGGGFNNVRVRRSQEREDAVEEYTWVTFGVVEGAAAVQHDIRIQSRVDGTPVSNLIDWDELWLFALRMDAFESHSIHKVASPALPTSFADGNNPIATVAHTPGTTAAHLILADVNMSSALADEDYNSRIQFDGTSDPVDWEANTDMAVKDIDDFLDNPRGTIRSIDTGGDTVDFDGSMQTGMVLTDAILIVMSLELASVGLSTSLFATADGSVVDVVNEDDLASPLFSSIDDNPASPDDTDWINNA